MYAFPREASSGEIRLGLGWGGWLATGIDALYSGSLLAALSAAGAALVLVVMAVAVRRRVASRSRALVNTALIVAAVGAMALTVSVVVHRRWQHGPGSSEPLPGVEFVLAHPAFALAGSLLGAAAALGLYVRSKVFVGRP